MKNFFILLKMALCLGLSSSLIASADQTVVAVCYGPGLYGNKTASGQRLTRSLLGAAHKHLPLGTNLTIAYKGKETVLKVVDRGPYSKGVELDLTEASVQSLGFKSCRDFGSRRVLMGINKPAKVQITENKTEEQTQENSPNKEVEKETEEVN